MPDFIISEHAREEIERRAIPQAFLEEVISNPQQIVVEREEREVYQSVLEFSSGRSFYRTSKIDKYWRQS